MLKHNSDDFKPVTPRNVHRTWKSSVKFVISSSRVCHVIDTPISTVTSLCTNVGTCPQFHSEERQVIQEMVQVLVVDNVYTSPAFGKNVNITYGQNTNGPNTDATLPVPTQMLAVQIEDFRAQLSVFLHGSRGPWGHILLEEMEKELSLRNTDRE